MDKIFYIQKITKFLYHFLYFLENKIFMCSKNYHYIMSLRIKKEISSFLNRVFIFKLYLHKLQY